MSQALRFLSVTKRPFSAIDGSEYDLNFEIGTTSDNYKFTADRSIKVTAQVSGTLEAIWSIPPEKMGGIVAGIVYPEIIEAIREERESGLQAVRLNTYTMPHDAPGLWLGEGTIHLLKHPELPKSAPRFTFLSDDISEVRDQINALAKSLWGDRILHLSQERALLDMYKSTENQTEFRARIQSLGAIAKEFNRPLLAKVSETADSNGVGDFILLELALKSLGGGNAPLAITANLKQINFLRQGYPAHGDNAEKFLQAHRHFDLPYPVTDFETAWEKILSGYFSSMKALRDLLSQAWHAEGARR